jgi:carbon-monoxide dehydrogenase medium subunit
VRLRPFELVEPETLDDAASALAGAEGEARLVAGGTAVVPMLRFGLLAPDRLVSLHRVAGLAGLTVTDGWAEIGATTTIAALERHPLLERGWPLLAEAARRVASPAIRSMGTLGGNVAYAEAASDLSPALLCLDAEVIAAGRGSRRAIAIGDLFRDFYETALEPGEIVARLRVPPVAPGARGGYIKFCPRAAEDRALVGVAALAVLEGPRAVCTDLRIGLAGSAPTPLRARRAESLPRGEPLTDGAIDAAAAAAAAEADPLSDLMGSAAYRRQMIRVWVRRLLHRLRGGALHGQPAGSGMAEAR